MVGKEQDGYLASYINEAQRAKFLDEKGCIVDQVLGNQISFSYMAASELKTYSHQALVTEDATLFSSLWQDEKNTESIITSTIGIEDTVEAGIRCERTL